MRSKEVIITLIGLFFLTIGILDLVYSAIFVDPQLILWFCYISLIILGISTILRKGYLIGVQICILMIPALIWSLDYLYRLILNRELFGFTNYMFSGAINFGRILSFQHFLTVPLALLALYFIKTKDMGFWKMGYLEIVIVYFLTLIFTNPPYNVNWVFREEFGVGLSFGLFYSLFWFFCFFTIIALTNYIIYLTRIFKK